jgi:hypothetical protein
VSVTGTEWVNETPINSRNAVRRIRNLKGNVRFESHLANADAAACYVCGQAIEGTVYRPLGGDGHRMRLSSKVTANTYKAKGECCAPEFMSRDLRRFEKRACVACGRKVVLERRRGRMRVFCSPWCEGTYYNRRRSKREQYLREKVCEVCGEEFTATRRDAKTCSPACKQKAYRRRKGDSGDGGAT